MYFGGRNYGRGEGISIIQAYIFKRCTEPLPTEMDSLLTTWARISLSAASIE